MRPGHDVTRLGYEGEKSLPSSAEVKKGWSCTVNFSHAFMASSDLPFTFAYPAEEERSSLRQRVEKLQNNVL
jgi:hypothetical protein